ncbi:MAG: YheC/YheD family protein [Paenibacillaceae bacterium]
MNTYSRTGDKRTSIGILTMHDEERHFRGNLFNFIDLIRTGKELGAKVCVVAAKDIKIGKPRIKSFTYNAATKAWIQKMTPLPNVIYNRIPSRKDELQPEVQQTIQACMKHNKIHLFNPSFFDKWTLFGWLNKAKATKKYIPVTRMLTQFNELEAMLLRYGLVYLKPASGKAGRGIMKIELTTSDPPYRLHIQHKQKSLIFGYRSIADLGARIRQRIGSEDYIVQQGIYLAKYQNRAFDLRVLVQKNAQGLWSLTGIGARIAGDFSITTHVPRGGSIDEPQKLLNITFGHKVGRRIMRRVKLTSYAIAKQIEKAAKHPMGEMSLDLGVDTAGQIWFFEANSRPMKFDEPEIRKKSLERIIQYSDYLTHSRKKK